MKKDAQESFLTNIIFILCWAALGLVREKEFVRDILFLFLSMLLFVCAIGRSKCQLSKEKNSKKMNAKKRVDICGDK
jgi:hypothetical protein